MDEWRNAVRVELHDCNTRLGNGPSYEGIFSAYGSDAWRVDGEHLINLLAALGVQLEAVQMVGGLRHPQKDPDHFSVTVERVPIVTGRSWYGWGTENQEASEPDRIEARILGAHLLDLRLYFGTGTPDAFVQAVTYSGAFTVEWATE